jgi:hypothetical protein
MHIYQEDYCGTVMINGITLFDSFSCFSLITFYFSKKILLYFKEKKYTKKLYFSFRKNIRSSIQQLKFIVEILIRDQSKK